MLDGAGGPRQLQRARGVWDQPGPSGVCVSLAGEAPGDKGQSGSLVCAACARPRSALLPAAPGAAGWGQRGHPCSALRRSWPVLGGF